MRTGLALPHYDSSYAGRDVSWEGLREVAQTAEAVGLDSIWTSDHLFLDWGKYGGEPVTRGSFECWTTMSALAAQTSRVRIGSLALCNDLRNPALLAKMAASLDVLSNGRLDLALGAGWYEPEYDAAGIEFLRPRARIAKLGEAAQIVGRLLDGEEVTFAGEHYRLTGAICRPGPIQSPRPPIWIGGKGDRLLSVVARAADGWNFSWVGSIETYRERLERFHRACDEAGRDPATVRRSVGAYVLVGRDERDLERRYARLFERTPSGVLPREGGGSGVSWETFRDRGIAGTIDEVVDRLGEFADLGVEELIVTLGALPFQVGDLEDVELLGTELAPAMR
ncbi:MAG: LLM class flavin-dependent oxidoreductase [Actinomycetota bacterium]